MRSLETQISWFARIQMALAAAIVVAAAAFYLVWYRPATRQMQDLRAAILENNHNLELSRSRADELPAVAKMVADLRQKLDRFDRKIPRHQDLPDLLGALESLRQQAGIAKCYLKPENPQSLASYSEQTIHVDFEGDFDQVADFLARIEDMDRMTRVRRLAINGATAANAANAGRGAVEVHMDVSIYFLEG
jgi:Tfp pilus assembly protein PilO